MPPNLNDRVVADCIKCVIVGGYSDRLSVVIKVQRADEIAGPRKHVYLIRVRSLFSEDLRIPARIQREDCLVRDR